MKSALPFDTCAAENTALTTTRSTDALNPNIKALCQRVACRGVRPTCSLQPSSLAVRVKGRVPLTAGTFGSLARQPRDTSHRSDRSTVFGSPPQCEAIHAGSIERHRWCSSFDLRLPNPVSNE
jgi:hypothetical protein